MIFDGVGRCVEPISDLLIGKILQLMQDKYFPGAGRQLKNGSLNQFPELTGLKGCISCRGAVEGCASMLAASVYLERTARVRSMSTDRLRAMLKRYEFGVFRLIVSL